VALRKDPSLVPSPLVGRAVPAFELPRLDNPALTLSDRDLRGHPSLVNVWGTWCAGCRDEHDTLLALARTSGLPIYGINWKDDPALATRWLEQLGNPYAAVGVDADGRVAIDWGVYGAPETFLISAEGVVLYKHIAPLTLEVWREKFLPLLANAG
jgi:cytochrome c biogenesis protein CcmG/thiol:disulfide interchange protein DsbE